MVYISFFLLSVSISIVMAVQHHAFVTVTETGFERYSQPYYIRGANYWYGMNMGSNVGGNRTRLDIELDQLKAMGVNNLRIMAASEGTNDPAAWFRMKPTLMPTPGKYNEEVFQGLDYLLDAMGRRDMTAVVTLGNFWPWSGGFSKYVSWVTNTTPPYPSASDPSSYDAFTDYTSRFYDDDSIREKANDLFKAHIRVVQKRKNTFNGKSYRNDPVIMTWEIANEPQSAPLSWFEDISHFIKQGAAHQLVTSGIESKLNNTDFLNAHSPKAIDYCTSHLWVENWGIYNASDPNGLKPALKYAKNYINTRSSWAVDIRKPMVLEEFGMARDAWKNPDDLAYKYYPSTTTEHKDTYYNHILKQVVKLLEDGKAFAGYNFWAYSGLGRPTDPPTSYGMVWLGDPPHEPRGWYGVYDNDTTVQILRSYNDKLKNLALEEK